MRLPTPIFRALLSVVVFLVGCATIPGDTADDKREIVDALVAQTLVDLYAQDPATKAVLASAVGYAVLRGSETKLPFIGAGSGYGVAIENQAEEKTYLKITEFAVGAGLGRRTLRFVIIFEDRRAFNRFTSGVWSFRKSMEASAKSMDGGTGAGAPSGKKGYSVYVIADSGASAKATLGVFRTAPIQLKETPAP